MPFLEQPLRFQPYLRPMVWGGRRLGEQLGKTLPGPELFGESWDVSDHALHDSVVADGEFAGTSLRTLMANHRSELLGAERSLGDPFATFPWLIKFLDCRDWLSVQVHPDTQTVKQLRPGEGSKTEAWYILDADPGSKVFAGLKPGVGPDDMRRAVVAGVTHELLHAFEPRAGDVIFLPAGTVHAVGGGVLMAEIQETSDVTFRLFDWNRVDANGKGRDLHIEESFASIHWDKGPTPALPATPTIGRQSLVRCPFFHLDHVAIDSTHSVGGDRLHALIVVSGRGRWADGRAIETGHVWLLPASMSSRTIHPEGNLRWLDATLP